MPMDFDDILLCPVCSGALSAVESGRTLACRSGHRYDAARQGYFNLLTGKGTAFKADTAEMVEARAGFLRGGHYRQLRSAIADYAVEYADSPSVILDAGAGTGYYLEELHRRFGGARSLAVDISKFALRRSARGIPAGISLVWDIWQPLPVRSASVDLIVNIFAPRNPGEFRRVIRPNGVLIVVTPLPGHLKEIATAASLLEVPPDKAADISGALHGLFVECRSILVEQTMELSRTDVRNAALMGPAAHHIDRDLLDQELAQLPPWSPVSARFTVQVFRAT